LVENFERKNGEKISGKYLHILKLWITGNT
jgi:hypothetical protein